MDYGKMVGNSFAYAKEGLVGKWVKWILLIISCIIFPFILGYMVRIFKGAAPSPELGDWGGLFIDGVKLFVVALIYAIPILILEFLALGTVMASAMMTGDTSAMMTGLAGAGAIAILLVIVAVVIGLITATAYVRFALTGSFGEAFNFDAIFAHIGKIGWIPYIIALIIMVIILGIIEGICMLIPKVGIVVLLIILPFLVLFYSRYLALLYNSAGTA
ncbi:MAG: DUF4013 domain-containing protein [Methanoregula sp.]|jgi:hypothetical protein|uniref:DUF4013 domain-containing protein n=1 Tax=Methanoregula sp. TaxID=2052170 RepID=UPI003D1425BD